MSWRAITVDGVEYRWKCGRVYCQVQRKSDGVSIAKADTVSIAGGGYGQVRPSNIERLIRRAVGK